MKILCSICARAGSKGLLKKNIKKFVNKPLIFYTINQAKKTNIFDKIVCSSDSLKILQISTTIHGILTISTVSGTI